MSPALLFAALALAPPDAAEVMTVPAEEARREAEDLATFAVLLADAVTPLYADLDPPKVQSAILPGGDAVFLLDLPPVRADDDQDLEQVGEKRPTDCTYLSASAWERAKQRAKSGGEANVCATCHGGAKPGGTLDDLKRLDDGRKLSFPSPAPEAPDRSELVQVIEGVLREYAGNLRAVPAGGRVSVGVTLGAAAGTPGSVETDGVGRLTDADRQAIEAAAEEATLLAGRGRFKVALEVVTDSVARTVDGVWTTGDARASGEMYSGRDVGDVLRSRFDPEARVKLVRLMRLAESLGEAVDGAGGTPGTPPGWYKKWYGGMADAMEAAPSTFPFPARLTISIVHGSGEKIDDLFVSVRDPAAAE